MAIKVVCACGKKLAVKDELAGKKVKCPACQKPMRVPKPKIEEVEDEWDLGDSAEEDFDDEPAKSRGGKSAASRGTVSRKSVGKGQGKKSKSTNRGLLIGLSAGGGVLVVALLAWLLWPVAEVAPVADQPKDNSTGGAEAAASTAEPRYASFSEFTDGMNETLMAGMVSEGHSVPWTMPGDVSFDAAFPSKENTFVDGAAMFADGSIRHLRVRDSILRPTYRALFTIGGNESASFLALYPPGADTSDPTYPTQEQVRHAEARIQNKNSLKAIAVAFHNYNDTYKHLPPATVYGSDGKPWHSWRVLILPLLGHQALYDEYDQGVPWNDPKNAAVIAKMPKEYRDPLSNDPQSTLTPYLVITGPGTAFPTGNAAREMPRPTTSAPNSAALAGNNSATPKTSANPPASDVTGDLKALQGDWHVVEMQSDPPLPPQQLETFKVATISFVGDSMIVDNPAAGVSLPPRSIQLDSSQNPKAIDVMPPAGVANAKQQLGIYAIENDVLRLFLAAAKRPTSFTPIKGLREGIMVLHRGRAAGVTNAPATADKFDHKAYELAKPKLDALKIPHQLVARRDAPEIFPDGVSSAVQLGLPDLRGFDIYPDNVWTPLRSISHVHVMATETGDGRLKQLAEHPGLIGLGFRKPCTITATGLAHLKKSPHLRSFMLNEVPITPEVAKAIGELHELRVLNIDGAPVTGEMVESFLPLKNLVGLSLQNTGLTDAEAAQIAKLSKLQTLFLDQSKITDQGLQSLKSLSGLTLLSVRGLNVSPQAIADLQQALPKCKILK